MSIIKFIIILAIVSVVTSRLGESRHLQEAVAATEFPKPPRTGWVNANLPYWSEAIPAGQSQAMPFVYPITFGSYPMTYFKSIENFTLVDINNKTIQLTLKDPAEIDFEGKELDETRNAIKNATNEQIKTVHNWDAVPVAQILDEVLTAYNLKNDLATQQRLNQIINRVVWDASVIITYYKVKWNVPRPNQVDKNLETHLCTHRGPTYPSAVAGIAQAATTVLTYFFPGEKARLDAVALEGANSRVTGGVHFASDSAEGLKLGQQIGEAIVAVLKEEVDGMKNPIDHAFAPIDFDPGYHMLRNFHTSALNCSTSIVTKIGQDLALQP
jgi:hypothetical protein